MVDIVRETADSDRVITATQRVKDCANPPADEEAKHDLNILLGALIEAVPAGALAPRDSPKQ